MRRPSFPVTSCLISTDAQELQMMIDTCQTRSEKAQMQLNADKTKIMCFHHASLILVAFITGNSSLEPLIEGLYAQIHVNLR